MEIRHLPIEKIRKDPYQPRQVIDDQKVRDMAASIKTEGVINPIEVDRTFTIVTGEMRWRAAKLAGLKTIPVKIFDINPEERFRRQVIENIHHNTMTDWDTAVALKKLLKSITKEHEHGGGKIDKGISALARMIGKSTAYIAEHVEMLDYSPRLQKLVKIGKLKFTNLRVIRATPNKYVKQMEAKMLRGEFVTRDAAQAVVAAINKAPDKAKQLLAIDYSKYPQAADVITVISKIVPRFSDIIRESYTPPKELTAIKNALIEWFNKYPKQTLAPIHTHRISLTLQVMNEAMVTWAKDRKALNDKH